MFKFLKEKLKDWTKKLSGKAEAVTEKPEAPKKEKAKVERKIEKTKKEVHLETELEKEIEHEIAEEKIESQQKGFFGKLKDKLSGKVLISEKEFETYSEDLQMLLLENNVAFEVAEKIIKELGSRINGQAFLKKEIESEIREALKEIIENILVEPFDILARIAQKTQSQKKEPYTIIFVGVNGTGKTTTIAKVADFLKRNGISCIIAAGDTFRAASIEQIKNHGERLGIKVVAHQYGSDPAAVGFDAISYAKKNSIDCVLIDTAGRMHTAKNLLKEIEKIVRVCKPDLKLFIGESITGNDSIEQAKSFNWSIGIDGIVLTKADVDEKGGTALSVGYVTKKPILFLGTGQEYRQIEVFNKQKFLKDLGL